MAKNVHLQFVAFLCFNIDLFCESKGREKEEKERRFEDSVQSFKQKEVIKMLIFVYQKFFFKLSLSFSWTILMTLYGFVDTLAIIILLINNYAWLCYSFLCVCVCVSWNLTIQSCDAQDDPYLGERNFFCDCSTLLCQRTDIALFEF